MGRRAERAGRIAPGPGQESVWDYPRPPRLEPSARHVRIEFNGETIADSRRAYRVLETSHPPVYYLPPADVRADFLSPTPRRTVSEWKGTALYHAVTVGHLAAPHAAWACPNPTPAFAPTAAHPAFSPSTVDACFVAGVRVEA